MRTFNKLFVFFLTITIFLMFECLFAENQNDPLEPIEMASPTGYAYLEGETDHSGIKAKFIAQSPTANTDSTYTIANGSYSIGLSDGVYEIRFSKDGFLSYTYPETPTLSGTETLDDVTLQAGVVISGNVFGTWERGSSFFVDGDIEVASGDTLIIEPSVTVKFAGNYAFNVKGLLLAQGEIEDSIKFTSNQENPSPGDWVGIKYFNESNDNSTLSYCIIEYGGNYSHINGKSSIILDNSNIEINNCSIRFSSQNGIFCSGSNSSIINNNICHNANIGIYSRYSDNTYILNNKIYSNYNGISVEHEDDVIKNNCIFNNSHYGINCNFSASKIEYNYLYNNDQAIFCADHNCKINNNIFYDNNCSIYCYYSSSSIYNNVFRNNSKAINFSYPSSSPIVVMNIITNNSTGIRNYGESATIEISYNLVWNNNQNFTNNLNIGIGQLITINANGDSVDTYSNLYQDPLFASTDESNEKFLHLLAESPCIDACFPDSLDADNTIRDIGAYYFHQGDPGVPAADFTSNVTEGSLPLYVQFTNTTSGAVTSYEWNFGDNTTSTQANPVHAYIIEGDYSISLTVTGPGGVDTEVKTDYITVTTPHYPPEVSFSGTPTTGTAPLTVNFASSVVNDLDSLRWYFGDGGTSTASNPTYIYQSVGIYTIILHAYGPYGTDTETKTNYINVIPPDAVSADFSALPLTGTAPMGVQFTNNSVGTIDSVKWNFGDGNSSTDMNPAHEYQSAGVYSVSLNVYGPVNNNSKSRENYITVYDARPIITDVSDVPNDQGGKVFLRWNPGGFDGAVGSSVNQYSLWQAYGNEWISINNTLATQSGLYSYLASTFGDSTSAGVSWSKFKIIAHTSDPATFYTSPVDSGYSIDNIPPEAPGKLLASKSGNDVSLEWGVSNESNFMYYKVFRNWDKIAEQTSSQYLDAPENFKMPLYYQVSSIDDAGNESPKTNEVLVNATNLSWYVNVRADLGGDINDNDNFLGVANDATNAFDVNYDILEPPSPPNGYVALYFPHTGWNHALGDNFTQDVKPDIALNDTLQVWIFDVISDQEGTVDLTFNLSEGFPENATIILKNINTGESFLIADGGTISFVIATEITESFVISIGNNVPNKPLNVSLNTPATTGFESLTWTDNSEIEKGYIVYNSADGASFSFVDSLTANSISFTGDALTNLDINTQYWFKVTSYNVAAESEGAIDSLYTLSNIPSEPIITDSTLTTISLSVDENNNPVYTEFAVGITGGSFGQTTHYVQSDGSLSEATSQFWATKETWGTKTVIGLTPETTYSFKVKSRNGNQVESQFGQPASKSTGSYPTVSLINPVGPAILQSNSTYSVNWILSNPSFVDSVFVYYSSDSGTTYDLCKSLSNVNTCSWITPSEYLTYGGKIKVKIKDESGLYRYDESYQPFVVVGDSLSNSVQTGWTLWGVPLAPYVSSIADNLGDDFSGGWWTFDYLNGGYTINSSLIAGEGYWLATDADATLDVKGQPATSATTLNLTEGWELITNPLVTDVNKDSLLVTKDNSTVSFSDAVSNSWITSVFYHYNPSLGGYEMCDILEPWKGYWFGVVDSGISVTFPIHSNASQQAISNQLAKSTVSDSGWTAQIEINAGSVQDMALFGVDKNATDDYDTFFDTPKPPIPPSNDYVYMSFKHSNWQPIFGEDYMTDIKSPLGVTEIKEWTAQLITTVEDEPMTISWTLENFPEDIDLALDLGAGLINLKEQDNIEIPYSSEAISCIFKAGKSLLSIFDENVIPTEFSLLQNYPNPFNPTTTICYGLHATEMVFLKIYDINGRIVASLINEKQQAGWYSIQWNGLTESGNSLSTGLYFYRIQAGNFSEAKKMLFIK